jgi:O-methyltransferase
MFTRAANNAKRTVTTQIKRGLRRAGIDLYPYPPPDVADWIGTITRTVEPYTMGSAARIESLCSAVEYLVRNKIPGDIAECGVWRGGSMMAAALALKQCGDTTRTLHLYDTYEGMTDAGKHDRESWTGKLASDLMRDADENATILCKASLDDVRANLASTLYPAGKMRFVQGRVEDTIPDGDGPIALLRLDTDWYESTRHELEHLYPRLVTGGVLIIDDYGYWAGARKAVDDYIAAHGLRLFLHRIDHDARIAVKQS